MKTIYSLRFLLFFFLIVNTAWAGKRYWVGAESGNWSSSTNWSNTSEGAGGYSVPGSSDTAYFVEITTTNCSVDQNISVAGLRMEAGYTGTIRLYSGVATSIGSAGYYQTDGTFSGNDGDIVVNGSFNLNGGVFESTIGELQIAGGYTNSGGTFYHSDGTIAFTTNTQVITGNTNFFNVKINSPVTLGGNMDIDGNLTIGSTSNSKLDVNIFFYYQINIAGNWTNNNSINSTSFNQQNGRVVFDGSSTQQITLASSSHIETLYNVDIKNTGGGLILNSPLIISNSITFYTGIVYGSSSNTVLLINAATATGSSPASFVSGPVIKTGKQAFTFPIGKNSTYAPIAITATSTISNQYKAEYFESNPQASYSGNSKDLTLDHISKCEYWVIDRTVGSAAVAATLSWDFRSCGVTNLNEMRVANWNGTSWKDLGNGSTTGTTDAGTITSGLAINPSHPITLASNTTENPLPIKLISFTAQCNGDNVLLKWCTGSEIKSAYFTIERSKDGLNYTEVEMVAAAGNSSSTTNYSFTDKAPITGVSYYRLRQIDSDGHYEYSFPVSVNYFTMNQGILVFPNPVSMYNNINIYITGLENQKVSIKLKDAVGNEIYTKSIFVQEFKQLETVNTENTLAAGSYIVTVVAENAVFAQKLVVR